MPKTRGETEGPVKRRVKQMLDDADWFYWMPVPGPFGGSGISDIHAVWNGVFMVIETKFKGNQYGKKGPTALQAGFLNSVRASGHFAFVVDETNIDWLKVFLQDMAESTRLATHGMQPSPETGARMLNAIGALTAAIPTNSAQSSVLKRGPGVNPIVELATKKPVIEIDEADFNRGDEID